MQILKNVSLAEYTTFKIGGFARYFLIIKNDEDLVRAMQFVDDKKLPYFVLGGGSNVLVGDDGYDGVVIKMDNKKIVVENCVIGVSVGTKLMDLVNFATENGLTGLEWAAGIPGTVGGAVRGNAGAFGGCVADNLLSLRVICVSKLRGNLVEKKYCAKNCQFKYRDSIFKHNNDIVVSVEFKLQKGDKKEIKKIVNQNLKTRKEKHPLEYPSAGCVFKNIDLLSREIERRSSLSYSAGLLCFARNDKILAAKLIEDCNLKGKQIGGAMISEKHSNFIVNIGNAKAKDVLDLIDLVKKEVKNKFGVELGEELGIMVN
ncbi:MAG: UDP-N-acetylmuramate dehydrogenase [bacterium]